MLIITIFNILFEIGKKAGELHKSGADKQVIDAVHDIVKIAHKGISEHHDKHVLKKEEA